MWRELEVSASNETTALAAVVFCFWAWVGDGSSAAGGHGCSELLITRSDSLNP